MKEWTEKHRTFEIGEKVVIKAQESSSIGVQSHDGNVGTITSFDCPMNEYFVDLYCETIPVSPFEIEPYSENPALNIE